MTLRYKIGTEHDGSLYRGWGITCMKVKIYQQSNNLTVDEADLFRRLEFDNRMRERTLLSMVISQRSRTRPILFSPPITFSSSGKFSRPATGSRTPTHLSAHLSADVIDELESSLSAAIMGCVQSILILTASRGAASKAVNREIGRCPVRPSSFLLLHSMLLVAFFGPVCHILRANAKSGIFNYSVAGR